MIPHLDVRRKKYQKNKLFFCQNDKEFKVGSSCLRYKITYDTVTRIFNEQKIFKNRK